jgi:hypothetical protein
MQASAAKETSGFLLAQARKAGFPVKPEKLRRWQRRGLLQPVQRRSLGRGRGTESLYPPGSAKQLVALCTQIKKRRVLWDAAWAIWWEGYWVEEVWILDRLITQLARMEPFFAAWSGDGSDTSQDLFEGLDSLSREKRLTARFGSIRRRLGQDAFLVFLVLWSRVLGGDLPVLSDREGEPQIMADGLGSRSLRDVETDLQAVSKVFDFHRLRDALSGATFQELCEARDELRGVLDDARGILADILDAVGLSKIDLFSKALDPSSPSTAAGLLLVWLPLRRTSTARRVYEIGAPLLRQVANRELSMGRAMLRFDELAAEESPHD